jgi:hypothetical protein
VLLALRVVASVLGVFAPYVVAVLANIDPPAAERISEYLDPRLPTER